MRNSKHGIFQGTCALRRTAAMRLDRVRVACNAHLRPKVSRMPFWNVCEMSFARSGTPYDVMTAQLCALQ